MTTNIILIILIELSLKILRYYIIFILGIIKYENGFPRTSRAASPLPDSRSISPCETRSETLKYPTADETIIATT